MLAREQEREMDSTAKYLVNKPCWSLMECFISLEPPGMEWSACVLAGRTCSVCAMWSEAFALTFKWSDSFSAWKALSELTTAAASVLRFMGYKSSRVSDHYTSTHTHEHRPLPDCIDTPLHSIHWSTPAHCISHSASPHPFSSKIRDFYLSWIMLAPWWIAFFFFFWLV